MGQAGYPSVILYRSMRQRIRISPERYFVVAAVALVALTVIVFTGAAVRVTARRSSESGLRSTIGSWSTPGLAATMTDRSASSA